MIIALIMSARSLINSSEAGWAHAATDGEPSEGTRLLPRCPASGGSLVSPFLFLPLLLPSSFHFSLLVSSFRFSFLISSFSPFCLFLHLPPPSFPLPSPSISHLLSPSSLILPHSCLHPPPTPTSPPHLPLLYSHLLPSSFLPSPPLPSPAHSPTLRHRPHAPTPIARPLLLSQRGGNSDKPQQPLAGSSSRRPTASTFVLFLPRYFLSLSTYCCFRIFSSLPFHAFNCESFFLILGRAAALGSIKLESESNSYS